MLTMSYQAMMSLSTGSGKMKDFFPFFRKDTSKRPSPDSDYLSDGTLRPAAPLKVCDGEIADRWLHQLVIVLRLWARYRVWSRLHLVLLTIQLCLTGAAEVSFFDAA